MEYSIVTIRYQQQEADLELPVSVPLFVLIPILMDQLGWLNGADVNRFIGRIQRSKETIRPNETLAQLDVTDGDVLELSLMQGDSRDHEDTHLNILRRKATGKVYLESIDTGDTFAFQGRTVLVGRGSEPNINLSKLPASDVVSRRHANIVRSGDGFWITDVGSVNGTFVDGIFLRPNERLRLRNGCQVQFGQKGPIFIFHSGQLLPEGET